MPMNPDFTKFHQSIGYELLAVKDRVGNLIGMANAAEEGRYREGILNRVIREHVPEKFAIAGPRKTKSVLSRRRPQKRMSWH